ncbi:type II secretion system F family protein [Guptibacillus algicola]|uniref:type II secretion system F family protein n=1 Tax=Guptibacillus algicola TaxID=225844 RepID=UPI001CD1F3AE|nr:type II secretion system F family protein [Alkalihalobacillus algicola]MCA0986224.1 type II secretion system F family protein [Alkalihalobacillus algicola]
MSQFQYVGKTMNGRVKKGNLTGATKRDVILQLKDKGIAVMEIQEVEPSLLAKDITIGNPVKLRDFVVYLRQFATLLRAGVSIVDSTAILAQQTESKALKHALQDVEIELRAGNPFSQSAAKHKKVFPAMFINMIYAGEVSGSLDNVLDRLALYYEKQHKTRQKVISAMTYPVIVGLIAIGVVIFLLASVVPSFASMLNDLGGELPVITKVVLGASEFVQLFWWLIIMVFLLIVGFISIIRNKPSSKYYFDYAILKTPIFGKILQKATMAQMTRTLSSLFSSSVPILQSISIVEKVVGNEVVVKVLRESRTSLEQGKRLTEPFKQHWIFPPLVTQMIAIGEESGSLDAMLAKVADFYEDEVENATDRLKALIEPLMIVFLAAIVGVIVLSIIVPMFEIYNNVG